MRRISLLILLLPCTLYSFSQNSGQQKTEGTQPFVLGLVEQLSSAVLGEKRTLNIYLPQGYNPGDTTRYPVVYLLDGSADEDFIHIVGLYQFNSFEWIHRVPKSIIVGIANVDRRRDFTYPTTIKKDKEHYPTTGGSARFISFLQKELQPFIEKKYKTNGDRTIIGESLGGLLAAEILLKNPDLFTTYLIISPSLWWDNGSLLKQPSADRSPKKRIVYIGVEKEGPTPAEAPAVIETEANQLADKIKAIGNGVTVYYDYLPQEDHATIMHQAVLNALRLLSPAGNPAP